jgi:glutamine amidotransferase
VITIVDYGMGNLGSIQNMFRRIGASAEITGDPARVARASKILLPGVGAFNKAM